MRLISDCDKPIQSKHKIPTKHIYTYSLALEPEKHQPSGTCNFSKIEDIFMEFETNMDHSNDCLRVYAINYNVLIITSNNGGISLQINYKLTTFKIHGGYDSDEVNLLQ